MVVLKKTDILMKLTLDCYEVGMEMTGSCKNNCKMGNTKYKQ